MNQRSLVVAAEKVRLVQILPWRDKLLGLGSNGYIYELLPDSKVGDSTLRGGFDYRIISHGIPN